MISYQKISRFLLKAFFFSIPFGFVNLFIPQLNLPFLLLILMVFFDLLVFKKVENSFKITNITFLLFLLVFVISLLNYVPGYPGAWSFLRQLALLTIGFYSLCRMFYASSIQEIEIQQVFVKSVFLLSVFNIFGIGKSLIDGRVSLFGMNPNILGFFSVIAVLFLSKRIFLDTLRKKSRNYNIVFLLSILYMLFSTGSRGAIISLLLIIVSFFYFKEKRMIDKVKYVLLSSVLSFLLYIFVLNNELLNRRFFGNDEDTDAGRILLWEKVLSIVENHPVFGVGIFKYQQQIEALNYNRVINTHNEFLSFLVYAGIIGLLLFVYFLGQLLKLSIKRYKASNDPICIVLLLIMIFNLFKAGGLILSPLIWALFAYILVYTKQKQVPSHVV